MEWIEVTGRTVEEAKDVLLDRLGVQEDEAEFEVLEEPKAGLFGRTRGQARVRARVQPKSPRVKDDRRRRNGKKDPKKDRPAGSASATSSDEPSTPAKQTARSEPARRDPKPPASPSRRDGPDPTRDRLPTDVAETEAKQFLTDLVDRFGVSASVEVSVNDDGDLEGSVVGTSLGRLIGPRGAMIRAVEELVRTRLQHAADGGSTPKFRLDIGGYRQLRRDTISDITAETIEAVRTTGQAHVLDVVLAGERKVVHDRVGEEASDLTTRSEGEDPQRRVMVLPAN